MPALLDGQRFQGIEQDSLADPPETRQDQVFQDQLLIEKAPEFFGRQNDNFIAAVHRHMLGTFVFGRAR